MDEKLDFEKCKMQPLMQNYSYFAFLFEKKVKNYFMQVSRQNLNFVYLQKTKILILHLVAIKTLFTWQPNLEIS